MNTLPAPLIRLQVFLLVIPLALVIGYLVADGSASQQMLLVLALTGLLALPLFLKWHQIFVIGSINLAVNAFVLPGQPPLWVALAFGSLLLTILHRVMNPGVRLLQDRAVSWSLGTLFVVILITAWFTGGIGARALGSDMWGGKRYLSALGAIVAYFAISCRPVQDALRHKVAGLYVLSGVSASISNLIFLAGPSFFFLYLVFPQELAVHQFSSTGIARYTGISWLALALMHYLLLRYGLKGVLNLERAWRILLFLGLFFLSFVGGYRSILLMVGLMLAAQFIFERMFTARYTIAALLAGALSAALVIGFANKMPINVQRALTILPLELDARVQRDAQGTLDWRLQMWKIVIPDIPKYLLFGKGYSYSGSDVTLTKLGHAKGIIKASYEDTLISGNYHNGVLTLLIPFGIWGLGAFAAFAFFGWRVLYRNYRQGPDHMRNINTFFLCLYSSRMVFYLVFYGQFELDLVLFTSLVAISIALNGGERGEAAKQHQVVRPAH